MKRTILFLLLISGFVFGQNYKSLDSLQFEKVKEEFVETTGKNLTFDKKGQEQGYQYIKYKAENETFAILYSVIEKKWSIKSISGKFLTLFPIWKKYADPNAIASEIAEKNEVKKKGELVDWKFSNYLEGDDFWVINITQRDPVQKFDYIQISFKKTKKGYEFNSTLKPEIEEQIKKDFANDKEGNYTAFYDVFSLDGVPKTIKLKSRLNR